MKTGYMHIAPFHSQPLTGTPSSFSAMFSKGGNFCDFLFSYFEDEVFRKRGSTLKGKNFPLYMRGNNENNRISFFLSFCFIYQRA